MKRNVLGVAKEFHMKMNHSDVTILNQLIDKYGFRTQSEAIRFALSNAIESGSKIDSIERTSTECLKVLREAFPTMVFTAPANTPEEDVQIQGDSQEAIEYLEHEPGTGESQE
jgi:Arc/MetJ-type ribon-helix-helix transcriptional regulator